MPHISRCRRCRYLLEQHGLAVLDAIAVNVHGGSMRYVIGRVGSKKEAPSVSRLTERERAAALHTRETLAAFRNRVTKTGADLMAQLRAYQAAGLRVVGYGATSKSTTAINCFGITPDLIEFISDTTPAKHGTFSPGAHIPVRPHAAFAARYPDRALLFLWNHEAEVRAKEVAFAHRGGKWLVYVPAVQEL